MQEISKIKLPNGNIYELKDEELRHAINILLGKEEPKNNPSKTEQFK